MTIVAAGVSQLFHGVVCLPYNKMLNKDMPSLQHLLELPPPGSHPVLVARKLLLLGSFLQGIPSGAVKLLDSALSASHGEVMVRVVEKASRLVNSNDDLVGSLEGIECIMIESMYWNNAGNLRHAWLTNRRAMGIAQMMGLHVDDPPLPETLEETTRERIDPGFMWCRLVTSDRYLSLMLGLPQGAIESPFATPYALEDCAPVERMERLETVVGGLILQRNKDNLCDLEATYEIDRLLQDAASSMPPQWWLSPDIATISGSDGNAFHETIRIMSQFVHYHLLAQLHLPYLVQSSSDRRYDYSKIIAVNASREVLSRFVSFRGSSMMPAYCRGADFLAISASTTLCLAHIDACRQSYTSLNNSPAPNFLAHQRLGDRGLMERTLHIMDKMVQDADDAIARKISGILRRLLAIEAAAANGNYYHASLSSEPGEQIFRSSGNVQDGGDTLSISIPCLGTIKIEHGVDLVNSTENTLDVEGLILPGVAMELDDWALEGVNVDLLDSLDQATGNDVMRGDPCIW